MRRPEVRAALTSAPLSATLIVISIAVFAAVSVRGRLLDVLALPPTWEGVAGQPWTLLTVFFTTRALIHVAVAVVVLGLVGMRFERLAGPVHVLAVYVLAGLAGSFAFVATAALTGFAEPSVGGSAAFLGLVGALATSPRSSWGARLQIDKIVVVVLLIQLVAPVLGIGDWVSSAAHTTGLAVGGAYGYLLRSRPATQRRDGSVSGR